MPCLPLDRREIKAKIDSFLEFNQKIPKLGIADPNPQDLHFVNLPVHIHNTHSPTSQSLVQVTKQRGEQSTVQPRSLKPHGSHSLVASPSSGSPKIAPPTKSILPWWWPRHALPWGCPWWFHASLVLAPPRHPTPSAPASKKG